MQINPSMPSNPMWGQPPGMTPAEQNEAYNYIGKAWMEAAGANPPQHDKLARLGPLLTDVAQNWQKESLSDVKKRVNEIMGWREEPAVEPSRVSYGVSAQSGMNPSERQEAIDYAIQRLGQLDQRDPEFDSKSNMLRSFLSTLIRNDAYSASTSLADAKQFIDKLAG